MASVLVFIVPESPRWLVAQNRTDEAIQVLNKIASFNNKPQIASDANLVAQDENESIVKKDPTPIRTIFTKYRLNIVLACIFWFSINMSFVNIQFFTKYIPVENIYLLSICANTAQMLSKLTAGLIVRKLSLRLPTLTFNLMMVAFGLLYIIFHNADSWVIVIFVLGANFSTGASFAIMYMTPVFLFESSVAVSSFNITSVFAKLGAVIGPLAAEVKALDDNFPMVTFVILSGIAAITVVFWRLVKKEEERSADYSKFTTDKEEEDGF